MNDAVLKTIELVKTQVEEIQADLIEKKTTVNNLCSIVGIDPIYVIEETARQTVLSNLKGDEFFNKPAATAIRLVLEARKLQGNGPSTLSEIYDMLIEGGYKFDAKNEANSKNSLRVTLSKNQTFNKLPNKKFGLSEWYNLKTGKKSKSVEQLDIGDDDADGVAAMDAEFRSESVYEKEKESVSA